jgi:hypothetical protein
MKDVQATREASNRQKRTSSTSKHEISSLFMFFVSNFAKKFRDFTVQEEPSSGSRSTWIRIDLALLDLDPDPYWVCGSGSRNKEIDKKSTN